MRKKLWLWLPIVLMVLVFLCFPFRVKASEINFERSTLFSLSDESTALSTMTETYQTLLPDGITAGDFTATITSLLTSYPLCEYYDLFRHMEEQNGYGNALLYKTTLSIAGEDADGNAYSYDNITTTKPVTLTLTIPEYQRHRPNRLFMMFVKDSSGDVIELGRGTESITFETDFSYTWYYVAYVDHPSSDRIDFTVASPTPGDRAGDAKYRPQTTSTLCDWDNNVAYSVPYRYTHYRWVGVVADGDNDYSSCALTEEDIFEEGKRYTLEIVFYMTGNNPDVYINGHIPSWDHRNESGNWGEFCISYICTEGGLEPETPTTPVVAPVSAKVSKESAATQHICSDTDFAWDTIKEATETTDGEMRYQCKVCGSVKYVVPVSAYYRFNANGVDKIKNAKQGDTVIISTPLFVSFHQMVKDELSARPDVNLVVNYQYNGVQYQMLIPAGSAEKKEELFGDSRFSGFRNMATVFVTTCK